MSGYSPFQSILSDITAKDLAVLHEVTEGWYVEYKREVPNSNSIAKSISAFSNTYGGWLFYGIAERSKENPVAGNFPGIVNSELDGSIQRIRQAAAQFVNPAPHFDLTVLRGPCTAIGLSAECAIICINVPKSLVAPHVHKTGRIYRRVADGSEPCPENDRFILDQLFRRADGLNKKYREWIGRDPEFSKSESTTPFLRIMIVADLWQDRGARSNMDLDEIREVMGRSTRLISAFPFDTVYTSANGFVARQHKNNDPYDFVATWQFYHDVISDIILPLPCYSVNNVNDLSERLSGYNYADRFLKILRDQNHHKANVVDLNYVFNVIVGIVETNREILKKVGWSHPYFIKTRMLNVWRTVPYLDISSCVDSFMAYGAPICLQSTVTSPHGLAPDSFLEIEQFPDVVTHDIPYVEREKAQILLQGVNLFLPIVRAYGTYPAIDTEPETIGRYLNDLQEAGTRSVAVQQAASRRLRAI